jgi:hypothetical protein
LIIITVPIKLFTGISARKLQEIALNPRAQPSPDQTNNIAVKLAQEHNGKINATVKYSDI